MGKSLFKGSIAVAEESRDKTPYTGFLSGFFENKTHWHLLFGHTLPQLSEEEVGFIKSLEHVLVRYIDPEIIDRTGDIPDESINALKSIGAFRIKILKESGGKELSQFAYQKAATLCGSWCSSTTVLLSAHNSIGILEPIKLFGTKEQKKIFLSRIVAGEISAFALTEKNVGCDISKVETYATRVYKKGRLTGYNITGEKCFITNATKKDGEFLATLMVVIARIVDFPEDISDPKAKPLYGAFVVDTRSSGCSVKKLWCEGVRAICNGMPRFTNVFVPVENRIGSERDGLRIALSTLTVGRLTLPAACLGGMKQCLWLSRSWAKKRVQWNKPIGEHTITGEKIVRMAARIFALEAVMAACGMWADQHVDVRLESAASKILGSEWHLHTIQDAFQIYSGRSFITPESQMVIDGSSAPLARMLRDAPINPIWEGTSEILRVWLVRECLAKYIEYGEWILTENLYKKFIGVGKFITDYFSSISFPLHIKATRPKKSDKAFLHEIRHVKIATHKLTHTAIKTVMKHRQKLAVNQLVGKELIDPSLSLFALSILFWYAALPEIRERPLVPELVQFFFDEALEDLYPRSFSEKTVGNSKDSEVYRIVKRILEGEADWLEDGIIKISTL